MHTVDSELWLHAFYCLNVLTFLNVPIKIQAFIFQIFTFSIFHVEKLICCVKVELVLVGWVLPFFVFHLLFQHTQRRGEDNIEVHSNFSPWW